MEETIFHKILRGELPSDSPYEDDDVFVLKDIAPKAPTHLLFIPKEHAAVASIIDCSGEQEHVPGMLIQKARQFASDRGIDGYKLVFHVGKGGGQIVPYLHLHFLSQTKID